MEINFFLKGIKEIEFRLEYNFDYDSIKVEDIFFEMNQHAKPDIEKNEIQVSTFVLIKYGNSMIELARQGVMLSFFIDSIKDLVKESETGELEVTSNELIFTLFSVSIGTLRGLLYKNLKGTKIENIILPLVPRDMILKKNKK